MSLLHPSIPTSEIPRPSRCSPSSFIRLSFGIHIAAVLLIVIAPALWPWAVGALIANHLCITAAVLCPCSQLLGANITRLPASCARRGEVALTCDDGPDPVLTPLVLDLLDRHGAKASFFCIGERAARYPDLMREIVRRGHSVENHSDRHSFAFACFGLGKIRREILSAQARIEAATGQSPLYFRAPMGFRNPMLDPVLCRLGLRYVSWNRRCFDTIDGDADRSLRRLTDRLGAGDVLLLHDGISARTPDGRPVILVVLPALLDSLTRRNLKAVSLRMALGDQ
ncbi:MAG TPA: polysaccharide deacetylase family protein [Stellaceae bacterium]|nr:polysaccharide deacetylase family protein [Stellaceae bacterium]